MRSSFRAETRLGLPRPSLDSMRTTNRGNSHPQSEAETDYDSYYDDDDEDELEAQAEALLSRKHGEASEAGEPKTSKPNGPNKRGAASATDQDIADEYAEQEKERKKKTKRKVHHTITPDDLIKPKGLTVVRNGIAPRFHSNVVHVSNNNNNSKSKRNSNSSSKPSAKYSNTTKSMAKYSRRLISGYSDWMENMTGGLSLHETQWKLRSMGSKTQIKQYLVDMRKTVRNDHVERLLGLEKAERLLGQLEDYYNDEQQYAGDGDEETNYYDDRENSNYDREIEAMEGATGGSTTQTSSSLVSTPAIANPYANSNKNKNSVSVAPSVAVTPSKDAAKEQQQQQQHTNDDAAPTTTSTGDSSRDVESRQQGEDLLQRRLRLQKEHRAARRHVLEDSDDEEEAIFDDGVVSSTTQNANDNDSKDDSSTTSLPARTKAARRHVLDDDSDDDDSDDDDTNDAGKELEVGNADGVVPGEDSMESSSDEIQNKASVTEDMDQAENSNNERFTADSKVLATSTSGGGIEILDEKFQNVKALLEGGGPTNTNASPSPGPLEETEEIMEAAPMEEESDNDDKEDRIGEDAVVSDPMDNNEKTHQHESSLMNDDEDKSVDNESSLEVQPLARDSTTETDALIGTMESEDDQAAVSADGH